MKELIQQIIIDEEKTGLYISNFGCLYRQKKNGDMIELKVPHRRYREMQVLFNGKRKNILIHRLVAEYFVPGKTEERNVVHHVDNNPLNNHYKNLMWVTQSFNVHQQEIGFDRNKKSVTLYKGDVIVSKFESITKAAKFVSELGFSKSSLIKYKKVGDYKVV